jgi:hypothetical protein
MSRILLPIIAVMFLSAGILLTAGTANAGHSIPTGCSAIEEVLATSITDGQSFEGIFNRTILIDSNHMGQGNATDSDGDAYTDSLELCINDSLNGYCSTIFTNEAGCYTISDIVSINRNKNIYSATTNRHMYSATITFNTGSCSCGTSECSDQVDNLTTDGQIDFGGFGSAQPDGGCTDFDDDDENA